MVPQLTDQVLDDLAECAAALTSAGEHLRRAIATARDSDSVPPAARRHVRDEELTVSALWNRLGPDNRSLLYTLADEYEPGDTFTLEDAASSLGISKGSVRARLMNIGRSMKSLGGMAPDLWNVSWDEDARMNQYDWWPGAHRAVLRMAEG